MILLEHREKGTPAGAVRNGQADKHARLLPFAYDLKIESFWMELESGPSHLAGCGKSLFLQEVGALAPT
jgi:hypothetical protein